MLKPIFLLSLLVMSFVTYGAEESSHRKAMVSAAAAAAAVAASPSSASVAAATMPRPAAPSAMPAAAAAAAATSSSSSSYRSLGLVAPIVAEPVEFKRAAEAAAAAGSDSKATHEKRRNHVVTQRDKLYGRPGGHDHRIELARVGESREPQFIYDQHTDRRGRPAMYAIHCRCSAFVMDYQKDGPGKLLRCYLDRIHSPEGLRKRQYDRFDPRTSPFLKCRSCDYTIGTPTMYTGWGERRPAYQMNQKRFYFKK